MKCRSGSSHAEAPAGLINRLSADPALVATHKKDFWKSKKGKKALGDFRKAMFGADKKAERAGWKME
jgi:hypothetical protein